MRGYFFTNFYLSSIQQGIQPAHCIADMFVKYKDESVQRAVLLDWAANHKTMICLNGGNAAGIREIYDQLWELCSALQLPFDNFREDVQSLDGTMTCCGVIVPEHIYNAAAAVRAGDEFAFSGLTPDEKRLAELLNMFGLAK